MARFLWESSRSIKFVLQAIYFIFRSFCARRRYRSGKVGRFIFRHQVLLFLFHSFFWIFLRWDRFWRPLTSWRLEFCRVWLFLFGGGLCYVVFCVRRFEVQTSIFIVFLSSWCPWTYSFPPISRCLFHVWLRLHKGFNHIER